MDRTNLKFIFETRDLHQRWVGTVNVSIAATKISHGIGNCIVVGFCPAYVLFKDISSEKSSPKIEWYEP